MADPLSLVGLAAGLVSVGLQITGSVKTYLDAIASREEHINFLRRQVDAVEDSLRLVESLCSQVQGNLHASGNLLRNVRMCESELASLDKALTDEDQETSGTGRSSKERLSRARRKLTYPFREPVIHRLQLRVERLNGLLQIALQSLAIELQLSTLNGVNRLQADLGCLKLPVSQINDALPELRGALFDTKPISQDGKDQQAQHSLLLERVLNQHRLLSPAEKYGKVQLATSDTLLGRLVAKPDSLRELSDSLDFCSWQGLSASSEMHDSGDHKSQLYDKRNSFCELFCRRRINRQYGELDWGVVAITHEKHHLETHVSECPLMGGQPRGFNYKWGMILPGLKRIVGRSLEVSLAMTAGAGGYSIEHAIRYYAIVDQDTAPAFRLINLVLDCMLPSQQWQTGLPIAQQHHIVNLCIPRLLELFARGRARPSDLLPSGDSLITRMLSLILFPPIPVSPLLVSLLETMLDFKVPTRIRDSPLYHLQTSYFESPIQVAKVVLERVMSEDTIVLPAGTASTPASNALLHSHVLWALKESPALVEATGFNPLCKAVLAGDEQTVSDILRVAPGCIEEPTITGRSAIELAVREPACLRLLLQYARPQLLARRSRVSAPPLATLLLSSVHPCSVSWGDDPAGEPECHRPECVTLDLFLGAGSEQRMEDLQSAPWHRSSPHAKRIYLLHMRRRRQALKHTALLYLPERLIESLGLLSAAVLDSNVLAVIERLQALKIQLSPELECLRKVYTNATSGGSIYHYVQNVKDAELAWNLGFHDVSALDKNGWPVISSTRDIPYMGWLHAHGVDMLSPWPGEPKQAANNTTIAHFVASVIMAGTSLEGHDETAQNAIGQLAPVLFTDIYDGCECRCAQTSGCSPLLSGLKVACRTTAELGDIYNAFIGLFAEHINLEVAKAATRLFTFEALSLPHTCCIFEDNEFKKEYTQSDLPDLDQVFSQEIERFDEYIHIFFQELEAIQDHSAVNAEILKDFLHTTWTDMMQHGLIGDDNGESEEQHMDEAAVLGVVWHSTGPVETPDFTSLEYWVGEIDKILEGKPTTHQNYRTA